MFERIKRAEWCKKLLIGIEIMIFALFILVSIATFNGHIDALVALITGVFSLATISYGFYYWKAKCENVKKYSKELSEDEVEKVLKIAKGVFNNEDI